GGWSRRDRAGRNQAEGTCDTQTGNALAQANCRLPWEIGQKGQRSSRLGFQRISPESRTALAALQAKVPPKHARAAPAVAAGDRRVARAPTIENLKLDLPAQCVHEPVFRGAGEKIRPTERACVLLDRTRTDDFQHPVGRPFQLDKLTHTAFCRDAAHPARFESVPAYERSVRFGRKVGGRVAEQSAIGIKNAQVQFFDELVNSAADLGLDLRMRAEIFRAHVDQNLPLDERHPAAPGEIAALGPGAKAVESGGAGWNTNRWPFGRQPSDGCLGCSDGSHD